MSDPNAPLEQRIEEALRADPSGGSLLLPPMGPVLLLAYTTDKPLWMRARAVLQSKKGGLLRSIEPEIRRLAHEANRIPQIGQPEIFNVARRLPSSSHYGFILDALERQILSRDAVIARQLEQLRAGLTETGATQYLLSVRNAGVGERLNDAVAAVERAIAAFEPKVGKAALSTLLLIDALEGK